MARRGFLAELQHQAKVAARKSEQAQRVAVRNHNAAVRQAEQAQKQAERARVQASRAAAVDKKQAEAEARRLHQLSMQALADERNSALAEIYEDIDSLLQATLAVDDFVDLSALRQVAAHPPFDRPDLEQPSLPPPPIHVPSEPVFSPPPPTSGLSAVFGKKKQADALATAQADHASRHAAWRAFMAGLPAQEQERTRLHQDAEAQRLAALAREQQRYYDECQERERLAAEANAALDELGAGLEYRTPDAVQEYVGIVLSNSVYPDAFPVEHGFRYDPHSSELALRVRVPKPESIPVIKAFKYTKASDEVTSTDLPIGQRKERYAEALRQVALRTLHEVFEGDRRGLVQSISLLVGALAPDPATGQMRDVSLIAVAVDRATFTALDLSAVVPTATLQHLRAVVSKSPFDLTPIDASGVRRG